MSDKKGALFVCLGINSGKQWKNFKFITVVFRQHLSFPNSRRGFFAFTARTGARR